MGRPAVEITDEILEKVENFASRGLTQEQIALSLGIGERTFYEKQAQYPQFAQAIKTGRAKGVAHVSNFLFENAKKGNVAAQIFYLKNRSPDTWKDVRDIPGDAVPPPKSVTVNVIDARRAESDSTAS